MGEDVHERNARLRYAYLEAWQEIFAGRDAGDDERVAQGIRDRDRAGNEFAAANRSLAMAAARKVLTGPNAEDHEAAAWDGMWAAFAGTKPELVGVATRGPDGLLVPAAGWDPARTTFGGWAWKAVPGAAMRSVAECDPAHAGKGYTTFQKSHRIRAAAAALASENGQAPTAAQVAAATGETLDTVGVVLTGPPVSLSALIGEDSGTTFADMLITPDTSVDPPPVPPVSVDNLISALSARLSILDLLVWAVSNGLHQRPEATMQQTSELLGVGRGTVHACRKRADDAVEAVAADMLS